MNSLTRIMSYDKTKCKNQENCNCVSEIIKLQNQIIEYPKLSEEEIEKIISERYFDKDEKTKEFIRKSLRVHGDRYDYSLSFYTKSHNKITIICRNKEHGKFQQVAKSHWDGHNCMKCRVILTKLKYIIEHSAKFINDSIKLYGNNIFDYSFVNYVNSHTKVKIKCIKHNHIFEVTPNNHLNGCSCPICKYEKIFEKRKITFEEFLKRAREIHGNTYEYLENTYTKYTKSTIIICKKHGKFKQQPIHHIYMKQGCPFCNTSHGEEYIFNWLLNHNIFCERQFKFDDCFYKNKLVFDFYLPQFNLCIEYDGKQHYKPIDFTGKMSEEKILQNFKDIKIRDNIKNEYCKNNKINLLRIRYDEDIEEKLIEYFKRFDIL